jgi:pimeloyl-ACP methyl ester carboxylesterase
MLKAFARGRLFGEAYGTSTPWVLALPGWARTHADFDEVLAPRRGEDELDAIALDAIALDLPGFGSAPPPEDAWGSLEYATLVEEILEEMAPQVVLAGHSFGGRVALHIAARNPERICALLLTAAPVCRLSQPGGRPALRYRLVRSLARAGLLPPGALEAARRRFGSRDYAAAQGVMREVLVRVVNETYEEQLASLRCPVELIWGDQDHDVPLEIARQVDLKLRETGEASGTLAVLPGTGHLTPTEAPDEIRAAILRHRP